MKRYLTIFVFISLLVLTAQVSSAIEFTTEGLSASGQGQDGASIVSAAPLAIKPLSSFAYNSSGVYPWFTVGETLGVGAYFEAKNSGNVTIKYAFTDSAGRDVGHGKNVYPVSNDLYWFYLEGGYFTVPGMYKCTFTFIYNGGITTTIATKMHVF